MAASVHEVFLTTFLKKHDGDVYTKAAQRIAVDFFLDGWREMESIKEGAKDKKSAVEHIGL